MSDRKQIDRANQVRFAGFGALAVPEVDQRKLCSRVRNIGAEHFRRCAWSLTQGRHQVCRSALEQLFNLRESDHCLAVAGIQGKYDSVDLTVPESDLEAIRRRSPIVGI